MATKLWRGNTGGSVLDLQQKLNRNGYSLDEDGVFGSNTYNAVLDYQRKNNLAVDGVVGDETWGSLDKVQAAQRSTPQSTYTPYDPGSDKAYQAALKKQQEAENSKPGEYQGAYDQQLKDIYDKIMNREKFSYDLSGDPLWQQYKDQYTQKGRMAMLDTMGQAAALTGGYGSSYGQAVGQQQYNAYMQQLAAVMPELYDRARSAYDAEGNRMLQEYKLTGDLASDDYSKYQDAYNRWLAERSYAQGNADTAYDRGYNQWLQELNQRNRDREFEESVRQYNENLAEQKRQFNAQMAQKNNNKDKKDDDEPKEVKWGAGISTQRNVAGIKGSGWDYTKHTLETLLRSGDFAGAFKYMDAIAPELNEGQYNALENLWKAYGKTY